MSKQIFLNDSQEKIMEGVNILADAVASTLGPSGQTVIIHELGSEPYTTKDGVTVASSISHKDPVINVGIQLVKKVSTKMNTDSEDGTTTVTVICREMLRKGFEAREKQGFDNHDMHTAIDKMLELTLEKIVKMAKPVKLSEIGKIAALSANNDAEVGELFQKAFNQAGEKGHINIVESVTGKSFVDIIKGFVVDMGYLERRYANNPQTGFFEAPIAHVLIYDKELTDKKEMIEITRTFDSKGKIPLLIFAKDFSKDVIQNIDFNNSNLNGFSICPVKNIMRNEEYDTIVADLEAFTGAKAMKFFDKFDYTSGTVNDLIVKEGYMIFGKPNDTRQELIDQYLSDLEQQAENEASEHRKNTIRKRISKMRNGVTSYYVGGNSEIELQERKHRVVDAYGACKAALVNGIIMGGGQALAIIARDAKKNLKQNDIYGPIFYDAIQKPFFQILENSNHIIKFAEDALLQLRSDNGYNAKTRRFENLYETGVVDPVKVLTDAIVNATSISLTILSTKCLIIDEIPNQHGLQ